MKMKIALAGLIVCSAGVASAETGEELGTLIRKSEQTLNAVKKEIPQSLTSRAKCIAVFPEVTEVALVAGGKHGDGVASCKLSDGKWSRVGFVDISGASLGAQIGGKTSDVVLLFTNQKAKDALSRGRVIMGADVTASAGRTEKSAAIDSASDVVSFTRAHGGAFVGALVDGTIVMADDQALKEYYGQTATLEGSLRSTEIPKNSAGMQALVDNLGTLG